MIEINHIFKNYSVGPNQVQAVKDVSLTINEGEFVAIMGSSGSGKSTLMHILGLLDRPSEGIYKFAGFDVTTLSDEQMALVRNRLIGFVFQQFHLLPRMRALENAGLPLVYASIHQLDKAKEKLTAVGLQDRMMHQPNELSGGQQQRVAIARALVTEPVLLMADEPTGNLDSKSKLEIMHILGELNAQGKTIVMVTHEPDMAAYANRVIVMKDGVITSDTTQAKQKNNKVVHRDWGFLQQTKTTLIDFNKWADSLKQATTAMLANKMRSFLSILGILIGVAAVIAMLAIGQGAQESIKEQLATLGSNLLMVRQGSITPGPSMVQIGTVSRIDAQDIKAIRQLSSDVRRVSGAVSGRGQIIAGNKNWNTEINGVDVDYQYMRNYIPQVGRFFLESEVDQRAKVAVLGTTVVSELFGEKDPLGQQIRINSVNFTVIGVLPSKGASTFRDQDDLVIIPISTAMYRVLGKQYIDTVFVEGISTEVLEQLQEDIINLMNKRHKVKPKDEEDAFQVRNMADIKNMFESTTKVLSMLLGCIAAISLLVGGIGIMNIMLVSVTERTKEIGLRKAIGASRQDIMIQFLIESVMLSLIGGFVGVGLGVGVSLLITTLAGWAIKVSIFSILLATLFSLGIGIAFGLWPAHKASLLNPIEALRYE